MNKKSLVVLALVFALSLLCVTGCQQSATPQEPVDSEPGVSNSEGEASKPEPRVKIAAVAAEVGIPYFTTMEWGAIDAAEDYNVDLNWSGPAEWDFNKQMPFIDGALALNPDGIIVVPTDPNALTTYAKSWMEEGIGVISVDVALDEHVDLVALSSDQYSGGVEAANFMFEATKGEGTYLPIGTTPGAYGANERCRGFIERMKELKPDVKILDTVYPHHDARKASELASAAIMGTPDLAGIFVATSGPASGVSSAIIESGNSGKIKLVSFDADPQQIEDLRAGVYDALIAQDPYQMGYDSVKLLAQYIRGELTKEDFDEPVLHFDMKAVTAENVDDDGMEQFKYIADLKSRPERKKN